jgi:hypothetical protein
LVSEINKSEGCFSVFAFSPSLERISTKLPFCPPQSGLLSSPVMNFPYNLQDTEQFFLWLTEIEPLLPTIDPARFSQCQVMHKKHGLGIILESGSFINIHFPGVIAGNPRKRFEHINAQWFWFLGVDRLLYEQLQTAADKPLAVRNPVAIATAVEIIKLVKEDQGEIGTAKNSSFDQAAHVR